MHAQAEITTRPHCPARLEPALALRALLLQLLGRRRGPLLLAGKRKSPTATKVGPASRAELRYRPVMQQMTQAKQASQQQQHKVTVSCQKVRWMPAELQR